MQTGTKISGAAHLGLIGWALFGGTFASDPLPFEVREVTVISTEEFAALTATQPPGELTEAPVPPPRPEPAPEPIPEPALEPDPVPQIVEPDPDPEQVPVPTPPDAAPLASERVAPEPVAPPPPEARPDDVERPQVTPDEGADTPQEPSEATAPEEAADRIVTEAEDAPQAPVRSPRPPAQRPVRPVPETSPAPDTAVADALSEALSAEETVAEIPRAPAGPPLSVGEKDALRVAVSSCWNVGALSSEALSTTVVVAVSMAQDGKPDIGSIRMLSSSGGSDSSARQAYEAARRAIIRCGSRGFDLPAEKYDHWRDIEMTFNPERMRIK